MTMISVGFAAEVAEALAEITAGPDRIEGVACTSVLTELAP